MSDFILRNAVAKRLVGPLMHAWVKVLVATSAMTRPRYKPPVLSCHSKSLAFTLRADYVEAFDHARDVTGTLIMVVGASKAQGEKARNKILADVRRVGSDAELILKKDPDEMAARLLTLFCAEVPGLDVESNLSRLAHTWSSLLAPSVVMREKKQEPITLDDVVTSALSWVEFGYTRAAKECYGSRDTRFISAHPARNYQLIADTAHQHRMDHDGFLTTLIHPLLMAIAAFQGTSQNFSEVATAKPSASSVKDAQ